MEGKHNLDSFKVGSLPTLMYIPEFVTHTEQTNLLNNINGAPVSKWKSLKNRRLQNWGGVVHEKGLLSQDLPPWLMKVTQKIYEETRLFPSPINHVLINEYLPNQGIMRHQDGPAYFPVVAILSLGSPVVMDFTPHSRLRVCTSTQTEDVKEENFDEGELGSPVVMDFTPHSRLRVCTSTQTEDVKEENFDEGDSETRKDKWLDNHHPFSVLLMPRSLLIFKDTAYSDYLHGIEDTAIQCFDGVVNEVEALNQKEVGPELSGDLKSIQRTTTRISFTCRLVLKVHKNLFKF